MSSRWITVSGAVLAVALAAVGCSAPGEPSTGAEQTTVSSEADATSLSSAGTATVSTDAAPGSSADKAVAGGAAAALESLAVKGRAPMTGYDRDQFGPAWADTDHNGCDTRNDMLARDLDSVTFREGTNDCVVLTGVLDDPYTATEINFLRGQGTSEAVQIDHVVALADAWQKGAQQLDGGVRREFANDPLNLLAVDGPANMQKGAGDAATWLPANRSFRCDYVARQIAVKARYNLWVTGAEKDAMARVLSDCPEQTLPHDGTAGTAYGVDTTATVSPTPAQTTDPVVAPAVVDPTPAPVGETGGLDPRFTSCKKAKAAGYGPYVAGVDSEYHWYGDGDNDGINCE